MAEPQRRDELLQIRIARILIELALADARRKGLTSDFRFVLFELDLGREESSPRKGHSELAVDRPAILRREVQFFVVDPEPGARDIRRQVDAGRHDLLE